MIKSIRSITSSFKKVSSKLYFVVLVPTRITCETWLIVGKYHNCNNNTYYDEISEMMEGRLESGYQGMHGYAFNVSLFNSF